MKEINLTTIDLGGTGGGGSSDVQWTQKTHEGTNIASITINGSTTQVYAPDVDASNFVDMSTYEADQEITSTAINTLIRDKADVSVLDTKQDVLTAGTNITIENNVISAAGTDLSDYYTKDEVNEGFVDASTYSDGQEVTSTAINSLIRDKQNKLTAGTNITIDASNVISAIGGGDTTDIELVAAAALNELKEEKADKLWVDKQFQKKGNYTSANDVTASISTALENFNQITIEEQNKILAAALVNLDTRLNNLENA